MNLDQIQKAVKDLENPKLPRRELKEYRWAFIERWHETEKIASLIIVEYVSDDEIYMTGNEEVCCKDDLLSLGEKVRK